MLNLALAVITLLNALWRYLDERQREAAARRLVSAEWIKASVEAIQIADRARSAVERDLRDNPDRVRVADEFTRTGPG